MRILICVSGNAPDFKFEYNQVFVFEQIESVCKLDPTVKYRVFTVVGKGIKGYLSSLKKLRQTIKDFKPDIIHAHCGQVGALAVLQRSIPVITTFHGSDINLPKIKPISSFASLFSRCSVFISNKLKNQLRIRGKDCLVIPCGVDKSVFFPMDKEDCKKRLGLDPRQNYILFASDFNNSIKNPALAKAVAAHFPQVDFLEIKGRTRNEVAWLINGAELVLMTSHSEGSPQIIKEAVACGQQIVTVDVGDVREQLEGLPGCYVCSHDEQELVDAVRKVLASERVPYDAVDRFNSITIAQTILNKYRLIINNNGRV